MTDREDKCSHGVPMAFLYCRECSILWHEEGAREAQERVQHHQRCLTALNAALSPPEPTEGLRDVLKLFARYADHFDHHQYNDPSRPLLYSDEDHPGHPYGPTIGELRRARAALRAMPLQDHGWQPIKTAAPQREVWLFTPGRRLGSDAADDIRFECPANWTWATMWMPAIIPAPPMVAEQGTK